MWDVNSEMRMWWQFLHPLATSRRVPSHSVSPLFCLLGQCGNRHHVAARGREMLIVHLWEGGSSHGDLHCLPVLTEHDQKQCWVVRGGWGTRGLWAGKQCCCVCPQLGWVPPARWGWCFCSPFSWRPQVTPHTASDGRRGCAVAEEKRSLPLGLSAVENTWRPRHLQEQQSSDSVTGEGACPRVGAVLQPCEEEQCLEHIPWNDADEEV